MAAPVNANINVLVNTQQAMAQLRALQGQVATLNKGLSATSGTAAAQQAALAKGLRDSANASRMWQARVVPMNTAVSQFSDALDKGRMSLGQYTRFASSQLPGMRRVFRREFDMMTRAAEQNVKRMQTQYMNLGNSATGAAQAMAFTPTALNKQAAATAIAAQRQMMMNRMIDLGTTKLLNWGKNTQWAGRQLMVGFSIPLAMVGAVAAKAFKEIDKGSIAFRRVYGDLDTTTQEMERNLEAVKALGNEYTKYGIKLADTIELAADVAATGAKNNDLMAATEQTLRLATLGLMEHQEALEATVALQTAFGVSSEELGSTIDFLNVVENETILTMQDMAAAIPRVAPVVKGLGGDVKDLAVFMTAMREGGVTAEQGANALKSGLGRLINPTKAAREVMAGFGMSIDQIVMSNKGDLMGIMDSFGNALSRLGDFEQQQVLEKVFGKYQYARLGALFKNLANDASQAQRTIELTNMSMEDLATISERELGKIEEATSTKFEASIERMKIAIAPIGETFMKALMPIINTVTDLLDRFNNMPDSIKNAIAIAIGAIAGLGPIVLMTVGLIANGIANIGKFIQLIRKFFARLKGDASLFNYLTREEQEATTAAQNLSGATETLTGKFLGQQKALERLIQLVGNYAGALRSSAAAMPAGMGFMPVGRGAAPRGKGYNKGVVGVPGVGNKDTVPAMLTPGESVVTKQATQTYAPIIAAMNAGTLKMMATAGGATGRELPAAQKISLTGMASTYNNPGAFMLPGNQSRFGMDPALLTPGTSVRGINLQQAVMGNLIGSALVIEKELGAIAQNTNMSKGYFQRMANVAGPAAAGIADDLQDTWKNMTDAERATSTLDDVMNRARPKIEARLAALEQTGTKGAALAQGARRFSMFPASRADLERYGEQRAASVVRDPSGKISEKPLRVRHSPLESPIKTATKYAVAATPGTYALPRGPIPALPSGLQYAHPISTKTPGPAVPLSGGAMNAPAAIRSQMQAALQGYVAKNPMWAVPPQAMATIAQAGTQMGSALGINLVKAAESTTRDIVKRVLAGSGHRSPAPLMAQTGTEDGNAYGQSWRAALNKILMTPVKPVIASPVTGPSSSLATGKVLDNRSFKELSAALKQDLAIAKQELGKAFKQIPAFAHETLRNIKPVFTKLTKLFLDIGVILAPERLKAAVLKTRSAFETAQIAAMLAWDKVKSLPLKAKSIYETAMIQTMLAWDKVKSLPAKAKSAYETAMLRTMMAWDSVKRIPAKMTNAVSTFMSDLPRNLQRLRTKIFYDSQDLKGRFKERFGRVRDAVATGATVAANPVPRAMAIATAGMVAQEKLNSAVTRAAQAFDPVRQKISQFNAALTTGAQRISAAVQFMADPLARAVAMDLARQKIMQQFNRGVAAISARLEPLRNGFNALVGSVRNTATKISRFAQLMMDPLGRAVVISTMSKKLSGAFSNAVASVRAGATRLYESLLWGSIRAITGIENATAAIKTGITNTFNTAMQSVRAGATRIYESFLWGGVQVISGIEKTFSSIRTTTAAKWNQIVTAFNTAQIKQSFVDAARGIKGAATQGAKNIRDSLITAGGAIKSAASVAAKMIAMTAVGAGGVAKGVGGWLGTVNEKTGRSRAQSIGTAGNSAVMGLMGLSMAASFAGGEVGEMAQKIMPVTMGLLGLQMILPMLKTPFGLAIVAVAALAAVFVKTRRDLDNFAKEAAEAGANLGGFANRLKSITDATGYQFASSRAQERLFRFTDVEKEAVSQFSDYFEGEAGQQFLKNMRELTNEERYEEVAKMISMAIADGMDEKTAKEYGYSIAYYLGDAVMKQRLEGDFAAERFAGGIDRLIEIIGERQQALDELIGAFEAREVGQSGASRALARATGIGEFDTQKSMFAEGVAKMGLGAGLGAGAFAGGAAAKFLATPPWARAISKSLSKPPAWVAQFGDDVAKITGGAKGPSMPLSARPVAQAGGRAAAQTGGRAAGGMLARVGLASVARTALFAGAGGALAGTKLGAAAGTLLGPVGIAVGAVVGTLVGGLIAWRQYQKQVAELNENVGNGAMILGNSIQVLGEVRNAEDLLIEQRRNGIITTQEFTEQMEKLNAIERRAEQSVGSVVESMMMGGQVDTGALMQAVQGQLVLAGFEGELAKAVTGVVNPETVGKALFPDNTVDEIMGDLGKRQIVSTIITETLAGITPENAAQKIADVQNLWSGMTDELLEAVEDGLTTDEIRAIAAGKRAGEMIYNSLIAGAEEGMTPKDTSAAGYETAAKALATGEIPAGARVRDLGDGLQEITIDGSTYTARVGEDAQRSLTEQLFDAQSDISLENIFGDTEFTAQDKEELSKLSKETGMSAEDLFAKRAGESLATRQNIEDILAEGSDFDFETLMGAGLGETEAEIRNALQAALDKADLKLMFPDIEIVGVEESARAVSDEWAEYVASLPEDLNTDVTQVGLAAATNVLGEEGMAEILRNAELPQAVRDQSIPTPEELVQLVNDLSGEDFAGIDLGGALEDIFAMDAPNIEEAFEMYKEEYGGLSEVFGDDTQKIIDYLEGVGKQAGVTAAEIKEIGSVVKGLPDDMAGRLGIDKQDPESYAGIDAQQLEILQQYWGIYSKLPEDVNILSSIQFLTMDEDGDPVTPEVAIARRKELEKLMKDIDKTEDIEVKKTLLTEFVEKNTGIDPVEFGAFYDELVQKYGEAKVSNLGVDQIIKGYNISAQITADEEELARLENIYNLSSARPGWSATEEAKAMKDQIDVMRDAVNAGNTSLAQLVLDTPKTKDTGTSSSSGGGGGGGDSFVKTLKEGILEQIQLWADATATAKDLNNARKSFVEEILKGQGLFNQIVGIPGLSAQQIEQIMEAGPKGIKEFAKKYIKDGKISKEGQAILDAQTVAGSAQTRKEARIERIGMRGQIAAAGILRQRGVDEDVVNNIAGDPEKAGRLVELQDMVNRKVRGSKKELDKFIQSQVRSVNLAEKLAETLGDPIEQALEKQSQTMERVNAYFEKEYALIAENLEQQFEQEYGMSSAQLELQISQKEDEIDTYRESIQVINDEIRALEKRNGTAADRSDWGTEQIQKEIDANNDLIRSYERQNELAQRAIDVIKRQDEIRNRVSEALSHDLEQMSQAEEDIRETYEKRMEALDKVAEVNDYIINQQKQQIDLSKAISEGDIYAATRAAQQMRESSAQFSVEQLRGGLEEGVELEVAGLRTSEGLTREQAEQQIANIKEQSYQTSLQIRVLEDEIYNRQINQILPLKDKEYQLNLDMERITDQIAAKQALIKSIEEDKIQPIERQIAGYREALSDLALQTQVAQANVKYEGLRKDQWDRINNLIVSGLNWQRQLGNDTLDAANNARILANQWRDVGNEIDRARRAMKEQVADAKRTALEEGKRKATDATYQGDEFDLEAALANIDTEYQNTIDGILRSAPPLTFNAGGSVSGSIYGQGSRDLVPAMLAPGEFVIRKAMVNKYGMPLMNALNQGSFEMPRYSVGEDVGVEVMSVNNNMVSNINAPVYNTYDMKFAINGSNESADQIANKVMFKMKQLQNQQIRGNRGY